MTRTLSTVLPAVIAMTLFFPISINAGQSPTTKCEAAKLKAAAKSASKVLAAYSNNITHPDDAKLAAALTKANVTLVSDFAKAEHDQCLVTGDVAEVSASLDDIARRLARPADLVIHQESVNTVLGPVTVDGSIKRSEIGELQGQVTAIIDGQTTALVEPLSSGGLQASVGGHTLVLDPSTPQQVLVDSTPVDFDSVVTNLDNDTRSGQPVAQWSATSQAWLAMLGLTSTATWRANVDAEVAENAASRTRSPRSGSQSSSCDDSAELTTGLLGVSGNVGCALSFGSSVCEGSVALDGVGTISCVGALALCEVVAYVGPKLGYFFVRDQVCKTGTQVCPPGEYVAGCYTGPPGTCPDDPNLLCHGICHRGYQVCNDDGSGYSLCLGEQTPKPEICGNNQDDDCDGLSDTSEAICGGSGGGGSGLPDTGQTTVFHGGDDGTYNSGCQPNYTDNGDGTITDTCTGLIWEQQEAPTTLTWPRAIDYCEALTLAGASDWRLPNVRELGSIVDYGHYNPGLSSAFQLPFPGATWSSTTFVRVPAVAWCIQFLDGGVANALDESTAEAVRCVRGASAVLPETGSTLEAYPGDDTHYNTGCQLSYSDNLDGTVTDNCTGLTWETTDTYNESWDSGIDRCTGLVLAGHSDWRLPNIRELTSIIDYGLAQPALDPRFVVTGSPGYSAWSSSSRIADNGGSAWFVSLDSSGDGQVDRVGKGIGRTRCVRGGL